MPPLMQTVRNTKAAARIIQGNFFGGSSATSSSSSSSSSAASTVRAAVLLDEALTAVLTEVEVLRAVAVEAARWLLDDGRRTAVLLGGASCGSGPSGKSVNVEVWPEALRCKRLSSERNSEACW